jgi:hypothetical protein
MVSEAAHGRGRLPALVGAGVLIALVSGCATVPSGGPQPLVDQSGQQQVFEQPVPPPRPGPNWTPEQVVNGFLAASASFAIDPAAARQYLAPTRRAQQWMRNLSQSPPVVTIVTSIPRAVGGGGTTHERINGGSAPTAAVDITIERIASLSVGGSYQYEQGPASYRFVLGLYHGTWLIGQLPGDNLLLLTQTAFEQVFQPRDLYFFGPQDGPSQDYLVPDPVFVPLQDPAAAANSTTLADDLVRGLLVANDGQQQTWLSTATYTAFPANTTVANPGGVTISGLTARVSLAVPGAVTPAQISQMYTQLRETLTSSTYSPQLVSHVELVVNGKLQHPQALTGVAVPSVGGPREPLYFGDPGLVAESTGPTPRIVTPAQLPPGTPTDAVAVSAGSRPQLALAVPTRNRQGCTVYVGTAGQSAGFTSYQLSRSGGPCTSVSWDSLSWNTGPDLWAVSGSDIWVIEPGQAPMAVQSPVSGAILALRLAPDGVRAALLVQTASGGTQILLAAVTYGTGTVSFGSYLPVSGGLSNPNAIAWYTADDLLAVSNSELYEVPLTGAASQELAGVPYRTVAITTQGWPDTVAVRTAGGVIYTASAPNYAWTPLLPGNSVPADAGPAYPD